MALNSQRDIARLRRQDLLEDYFNISENRDDALVTTALRTGSTSMRDILAYGALNVSLSSEDLKEIILEGEDISKYIDDVKALGDLGRLVLLQDSLENDNTYGQLLLEKAIDVNKTVLTSKKNIRVLVQQYILNGDTEKAQMILEMAPSVDKEFFGYLRAELKNPFRFGKSGSYEDWLGAYNRFFLQYGLSPVHLSENLKLQPFDRLRTSFLPPTWLDNTLISVVVPLCRPNVDSLVTSVQSMLKQTWKNLELLIVTDSSISCLDGMLQKLAVSDSRIKILSLAEPQTYYTCLNYGFARSKGDFIAVQHQADWSHPERLENQIRYLNDNPKAAGCCATGVVSDGNLVRVRKGSFPIQKDPSSLLLHREVVSQAGEYFEVRRGADTEYEERIRRITGRKIVHIDVPLTIRRDIELDERLTMNEFPTAVKNFSSSYKYWHRTNNKETLRLAGRHDAAVIIPNSLTINDRGARCLDVVFAGDWQKFGGPQKSMLEEMKALKQAGFRIGILNLEAARFMTETNWVPLNDSVQELINDGVVEQVEYEDEYSIRLLILRYPPILQFFHHHSSKLQIDAMIILANQSPSEHDGSDIRYLVEDCHRNAVAAFKVEPTWVPQGPQVREVLSYYICPPVLADFDVPGILDLDEWWQDRLWYRSTLPVVGRHSRDNVMKWPSDSGELKQIYPIDGRFDVRIMGGAGHALNVLRTDAIPLGWTVYKRNELPVPQFLYALDYFVFYQHPSAVEAFGRSILEGLASGVVVILPEQFRDVFGEAAIYADPNNLEQLIQDLHSDFTLYQSQLQRSKSILREKFSYESYRSRIKMILSTCSA